MNDTPSTPLQWAFTAVLLAGAFYWVFVQDTAWSEKAWNWVGSWDLWKNN